MLRSLGCAIGFLALLRTTSAMAADPGITASRVVLMMQNQDDDLNMSYYAHGVIDTLVATDAVRCTKPMADKGTIVATAKTLTRQTVLVGKGETQFGLIILGTLLETPGCSPGPSLK